VQFILIARDGTDPEAPERRQAARAEHLTNMRRLKATGNYIFGGAILNENGDMVGSTIVFDFPDRAAFDAWLKNDPYVTGNVWQQIEVEGFRVAPV